MKFRVGLGFDLHRLGPGAHLILGGVEIPHTRSFIAHSDGDVLCHAIVDALLGAAGLGNIGERFPDTDQQYKGMSSLRFLAETGDLLRRGGFSIENVDSNILAEKPKLLPYFPSMREKVAATLQVPVEKVFIKAKTMEGIGAIGSEEAIAAQAVALISSE
ncbi:MAG TPA: 2-C-methyl-D-erythritol 2,4-cyclodiphosphate synthase [Terriglobia bacterium]|nr:2-C-methyl-D-erythritol 2,4-cyclodiphosphate synthase [Terriglobia bacterium]